MMGFRDAACFIMAAGLPMLAVTLALQPALKAKATITDVLEEVYAFEDAEGNDALCLRLADKGAYVLDCDAQLYARLEEHSLRGDTVDVLFANGETLQVACDGEVLFRQEGALRIAALLLVFAPCAHARRRPSPARVSGGAMLPFAGHGQ